MKVALLFLAVGVNLVLASQRQVADKNFLKKQKQILQLAERQPQQNQEQNQEDYANTYNPLNDLEHYNNQEDVQNFVQQYNQNNNTLLSKRETFNPFCYNQYQQAIQLFEFFYFAKDFETFYKAASFARPRVNFGQYLYALGAAINHRPDSQGLVLPPIEEVYPQAFVSARALKQAQNAKQRGVDSAVFLVNYTGNYPDFNNYDSAQQENNNYPYDLEENNQQSSFFYDQDNQENYLSYFREDNGLNALSVRYNLQNPAFYNSAKYGKQEKTKNYGEKFFYLLKQLLARYNLERFSNNLPGVRPINFNKPLNPGYNSELQYGNGQYYPARPNNFNLQNTRNNELQTLEKLERRFRDAIESGFVVGVGGRKIELTAENGADILGKLLVSHNDAVTNNYYGFEKGYYGYFQIARKVISQAVDPEHEYSSANGVVGNVATAFRDPVFYQLIARVVKLYDSFKNKYQPYKQEEVIFPEAKVQSVDVDKLVTYFEPNDFDLYNAIAYSPQENSKKFDYKARQLQLNNKPFTYRIKVNSNKDAESVVRVFIGPKYNAQGQLFSLQQARNNFFQLDQFRYTLKNGDNNIERNINDNVRFIEDQPSTKTLYNRINQAEQGGAAFYYNQNANSVAGFPARLALPKGQKNGYPLVFFVIVNPYEPSKSNSHEYSNAFNLDSRAYGYPFDRKVQEQDFQNAPNVFFKDVKVFQKRLSEINQ